MNFLKTIAVGRITADAKFFAANGDKKPMAAFTVAVNRGEDKVSYVECEMRGDRADKLQSFLVKGKEVLVEGLPMASAYLPTGGGEPKASLKLFVNDIQLGAGGEQPSTEGGDPV